MDLATINETAVYPWYFKVAYLGNVILSMVAVSCFFLYRKFFPGYVSICYILLIVLVIVASLDAHERAFKSSFFYSIKGLGSFINIGILFFAADTKYFPRILKFFYYACFFIMAATLVSLGRVGLGASRKEFLLFIRDYCVFLIWVFPFFFLQDEENKRKNLINLVGFLLIFVFIFSAGARAYLILYFLYFIIKFRAQLQTRNGLLVIAGTIALVVGGYFLIMNSQYAGTFTNAFDNLSERSGEDTRSKQLIDFLEQYDLDYLIQGVGPVKQWFWPGINDYYSYLDGQFLLISWWAGLPTALTYIFFLAKPLFKKPEIELFENIKGIKVVIIFWIAACCGFAIYIALSSDAYYYFISCIIGLATCQYTKLIDDEPAKTD